MTIITFFRSGLRQIEVGKGVSCLSFRNETATALALSNNQGFAMRYAVFMFREGHWSLWTACALPSEARAEAEFLRTVHGRKVRVTKG